MFPIELIPEARRSQGTCYGSGLEKGDAECWSSVDDLPIQVGDQSASERNSAACRRGTAADAAPDCAIGPSRRLQNQRHITFAIGEARRPGDLIVNF